MHQLGTGCRVGPFWVKMILAKFYQKIHQRGCTVDMHKN